MSNKVLFVVKEVAMQDFTGLEGSYGQQNYGNTGGLLDNFTLRKDIE